MTSHTAEFVALARTDLDQAAAATATWTRRRLVEVCLTLATAKPERLAQPPVVDRRLPSTPTLPVQDRPPLPHTLHELGPRYTPAEAAWSDDNLRDAHAAYNRGVRTDWAVEGDRMYRCLASRRRRAAGKATP